MIRAITKGLSESDEYPEGRPSVLGKIIAGPPNTNAVQELVSSWPIVPLCSNTKKVGVERRDVLPSGSTASVRH
jgi:hypothetical protein